MPKRMPSRTLLVYSSGPWHLSDSQRYPSLIFDNKERYCENMELYSCHLRDPEHPHMNDSRKPLLPKPLFQENLLVNQHFLLPPCYRVELGAGTSRLSLVAFKLILPSLARLTTPERARPNKPSEIPPSAALQPVQSPSLQSNFSHGMRTSKFTNRIWAPMSVGIAELLCRCRGNLKLRCSYPLWLGLDVVRGEPACEHAQSRDGGQKKTQLRGTCIPDPPPFLCQ